MCPRVIYKAGFLPPSLAVLWQAQETFSAPADKTEKPRGKIEHSDQEAVILSPLKQEKHWTAMLGIFSHIEWQ